MTRIPASALAALRICLAGTQDDPAVLGPPVRVIAAVRVLVQFDRRALPHTDCLKPSGIHPPGFQVAGDGLGPPLGQGLVIVLRAARVGMPFDSETDIGALPESACQCIEHRIEFGPNIRLVKVKHDARQDESLARVRVWHRVWHRVCRRRKGRGWRWRSFLFCQRIADEPADDCPGRSANGNPGRPSIALIIAGFRANSSAGPPAGQCPGQCAEHEAVTLFCRQTAAAHADNGDSPQDPEAEVPLHRVPPCLMGSPGCVLPADRMRPPI